MNERFLLAFIDAVVSWNYSFKDALGYVKDYHETEDIPISEEDIEHMRDFHYYFSEEIASLTFEYGDDYEYMQDEQDELTKKYFLKYIQFSLTS